eukprot:gene10041-2360_t
MNEKNLLKAKEILSKSSWDGNLIIGYKMFNIWRKVGGSYQLELYEFEENSLVVKGKYYYNNDEQTVKLNLSIVDDEMN